MKLVSLADKRLGRGEGGQGAQLMPQTRGAAVGSSRHLRWTQFPPGRGTSQAPCSLVAPAGVWAEALSATPGLALETPSLTPSLAWPCGEEVGRATRPLREEREACCRKPREVRARLLSLSPAHSTY